MSSAAAAEGLESEYAYLPVGVLRLDGSQRVVSANDRFCELFECAAADVEGRQLASLLSPLDRRGGLRFHRKLATGSETFVDAQIVLRIGERDAHARVRIKRLPTGWIAYLENILVNEDLTLRLFEAQERWLSVYRKSSDGIAILDARGRIVECNHAFFDLMEFRSAHGVLLSEAAVLGRDLPSLVGDATFEDLHQALEGAGEGMNVDFEQEVRRRGRILRVQMQPIMLPVTGFNGACMVVRDMTQEQAAEEERLRAGQAHFAGMAEVSTNILHNLGNVCVSVLYLAELLNRAARETRVEGLLKANALLAEHRHHLAEFLSSDPKGAALLEYYERLGPALRGEMDGFAERSKELLSKVNLMRDVIASQQAYARGVAFTEAVNPREIVAQTLKLQMTSLKRHDIEVTTEFEYSGTIMAQRTKLTHVLINLIQNAQEALLSRAGPRHILLSVRESDHEVVIGVKDSGPGIARETLAKIFAHGFTTKEAGHGFGLHFCATSAKEMGGELRVRSDGQGTGALFEIGFPKAPSLVAR